jgi:hypothetical protein
MNRNQAILLIVAIVDLIVVLMFPPFDSIALGRTESLTFDAFYPLLAVPQGKLVNSGLLYLEIMFVLVNAALAWIFFGDSLPWTSIGPRNGVLIVVGINVALMLLFPPFENYPSTLRVSVTSFDGFYFYFGDKYQRYVYQPILFLEVFMVLLDGAVMWLLLRDPRRGGNQAIRT